VGRGIAELVRSNPSGCDNKAASGLWAEDDIEVGLASVMSVEAVCEPVDI
jgi:hypothetical protein